MKIVCNILCLFLFLVSQAQSIEQITFTGVPETLLELSHRHNSNYLTISQHEYRMAFTEKYSYKTDYAETISDTERFHGHNWGLEIIPDYDDDGSLLTPIGFDPQAGLYYSKMTSYSDGTFSSSINLITRRYKVYEDIAPKFKSYSGLQSGTISKNERFMILSVDGDYSNGLDDLYVMQYNGNNWSKLTNLGSVVNTKYQEVTPYLATDNRTLFFSSDRKGGKGGFDVYMTERLDDTWRNWTKPVNVAELNTPESETSFCLIDTDPYAYFIRSEHGQFYGDIMQVPIMLNIEEEESYVEIVEVTEESYFKVVDGVTENSIPAELVIVEDGMQTVESVTGVFDAAELAGKTLIFKSKGYFTSKLKVGEYVPTGEYMVHLDPLTVGTVIKLENVLFERASSRILSDSYDQLDILIEVMEENDNVNIQLKGHTDGKGNPTSNLKLSQERVDAVTEYLRNAGINKKRITGVGYGGKFPIASNETEETRRLNRRVEFEIIE